jgi:uncharacterized membrane protein
MLFSKLRWTLIVIFLMAALCANIFYSEAVKNIIPIILTLSFFSAAFLHGKERYGLKNMLVFFLLTWLVSNFFEALSIHTGFPFGHYYYSAAMIGPRIFQVPLIIMPAYFGMGYAAWILAHVLLGQYSKKLSGSQKFFVPLIATFIMVIWDLCIDPTASTIAGLWVWPEGGSYFGVPLQNYLGWFLVVYIFLQIFALYIAKYDSYDPNKSVIFASQSFWLEAVAIYSIQGLLQLMNPFTQTEHAEIYGPTALVTVFTMMLIALLSFILIKNTVALRKP